MANCPVCGAEDESCIGDAEWSGGLVPRFIAPDEPHKTLIVLHDVIEEVSLPHSKRPLKVLRYRKGQRISPAAAAKYHARTQPGPIDKPAGYEAK